MDAARIACGLGTDIMQLATTGKGEDAKCILLDALFEDDLGSVNNRLHIILVSREKDRADVLQFGHDRFAERIAEVQDKIHGA
ncbi:hypothetical protein EWM64_g8348 [Hericium alpestre]|uniref:Uncharacterized protein n=1 Tax=Hericium alpestre TaxID=135208 RepID=A0A4Y9ZNU3_9AGAM|nr:hypothetical protein EWM64_g8348 [Hericium alpestre]